jgi:hypothetical protein
MSARETEQQQRNKGGPLSKRGGVDALLIYSATIFVSAALLFLVEPMFAKFILPLFGSTPAVWTGSMLFFQAALLLSYLYVHLTTSWLGARRQSIIHLVVVLLPLLILPIAVPKDWAPPADSNPIFYLLELLLVSVGLPFFAVAATNPLIQRWLADTDHPAAKDPYFLYVASNLGSVIGLLGYPLLVERELRLAEQGWAWTIGYGFLIVLVFVSALMLWRSAPAPSTDAARRSAEEEEEPSAATSSPTTTAAVGTVGDPLAPGLSEEEGTRGGGPQEEASSSLGGSFARGSDSPPTWPRRLRWVGLTFVPSSLMLGVTAFITTDITPVPLLWVIPLSLYLFSFVIVFSPSARVPDFLHKAFVLALPVVMSLIVVTMLTDLKRPFWALILLHLFGFFVAAMVLHGEAARDRPPARHLTEFYLWVSVGGALGGVFNALVAPVVFNSVVEYPLAIVLACLFLPGLLLGRLLNPRRRRGSEDTPVGQEEEQRRRGSGVVGWFSGARVLDVLLPVVLGALVIGLSWAIDEYASGSDSATLSQTLIGLAAAVCLYFAYSSNRALRFGLSVAAVIVAGTITAGSQNLYENRSFFGVYQVTGDEEGSGYHALVYGDTNHGAEYLGTTPPEPITYYHRTGPIGQVFDALPEEVTSRPAVLGLGTGTMACYNKPGQQLTFYEIDPLVEQIARDPSLFTYLRDCPGEKNVILGDARLKIAEAADESYGIIVGDAFSSDAIPVHLMTREAIQLFFSKLQSNGVLAMHISNRHLDLEPVLGNLAQDANLVCLVQYDNQVMDAPGKFVSNWVVMARKDDDLGELATNGRWQRCQTNDAGVWADDYSNLLSTFKWN